MRWQVFLLDWNGKLFFPVTSPTSEVFSDAAGMFGWGAFTATHHCFQTSWQEDWRSVHITAKKLLSIVVAAAVWGPHWSRQRNCFRSDNMAVVELLKSQMSQDQLLMHLLRCLAFYAAYFRFQFCANLVPGTQNIAADALSCNNMLLFTSLVPQGQQSHVPSTICDLLVHTRPDWDSQAWTGLFTRSLTTAYPQQQEQSTTQGGDSTQSLHPVPHDSKRSCLCCSPFQISKSTNHSVVSQCVQILPPTSRSARTTRHFFPKAQLCLKRNPQDIP